MLLCFHSRDPRVSLEPMAPGSDAEIEEATRAGVHDTAKLMAVRFKHQAGDA
jgi:hypothetical protein